MQNVEKKKALIPVKRESVRSVKRTLMPTLPQSSVVSRRFASLRISSSLEASSFPDSTAISSSIRFNPNRPRVNPEKSADWERQNKIPIQKKKSIKDLCDFFSGKDWDEPVRGRGRQSYRKWAVPERLYLIEKHQTDRKFTGFPVFLLWAGAFHPSHWD